MSLRCLSLLVICLLTLIICATDDGLTDVVSWDRYSLQVEHKRVYIFAGEFHYQRLPVPELWLDIFQKFKANGLNTVSIYFFWSYHSPVKGVFDFKTGPKDIQRLLDYAKQAGLYVIARPGPYCNAETNAGGLALWTSDGSGGKLRTSDETYHQAWLPWIQEVNAILKRNQITVGGPVILQQIENELTETTYKSDHTLVKYMEQIKKASRDSGIVVPLMHNEKGMRGVSWSTDYNDVGGAVNLYGLDSYPGGLSCTEPEKGFNLVRNYHQWFSNFSYTQPSFLPEFKAGWFTPWGGSFYDKCTSEHDPAYPDVYYKNNIGQRVTMLSLYMTYGGTNWGHSAAPVVYTSYDYASPLRETRQIQEKFKQTKLIALFTRVSKDLLSAQLAGSGTGYSVSTQAVWTWHLQNLDTWANFYILQQTKSSSRSIQKFSITMSISLGSVTIPEVELDGRQSKIIVTDYWLTNTTNLLYSSAEVLTFGVFDKPVLVLYLKAGQRGEIGFAEPKRGFKMYGSATHLNHSTGVTDYRGIDQSFSTYRWTQAPGATIIDFATNNTQKEGLLIYMLDVPTAWSFFAPVTTRNPNVKPNEHIFVIGPYLVRNATISNDVLHITGDSDKETTIEAYVGIPSVKSMTWNGKALETTIAPYGALIGKIPGPGTRTITLPALTNWAMADSLPEITSEYNDAKWTVCDKTKSLSPVKPITLPSLYSSDYGYYTGIKIYRARFDGKTATTANLTVSGGAAAGWNAWLNGKLVGGFNGQAEKYVNWAVLDFSKATLLGRENVLTVAVDYHGHDQTSAGPSGPENPRGILGAKLYAGNAEIEFSEWKIQGNAGGAGGGYELDPMRGPMNEGGLYGERMGWHLPDFDTSNWKRWSPADGQNGSGVAWYSTRFKLDIEADLDVPIGLELNAPQGTVARVQLFINGYQYGKYVPHIGPQTRFPIPPGIINTRGANTLGLSVWAQTDNGAKLAEVKLIKYGVYETGFNFDRNWSYLQPPWTAERLKQG